MIEVGEGVAGKSGQTVLDCPVLPLSLSLILLFRSFSVSPCLSCIGFTFQLIVGLAGTVCEGGGSPNDWNPDEDEEESSVDDDEAVEEEA